ncbi:hypothetical protein [Streptomyces sp. NPDC051572]|uniref:hypothetical protein n=1 Tax=Streptomyces sp. NPDC051572 TaxID=3155802 RepID=UPI00344FD460
MVYEDMDYLADEVREQVEVAPAFILPAVVDAVVAALRTSQPDLSDAAVGAVLMTAATTAARADAESGAFLSPKSMALALAAAGLQFHDSASASQHDAQPAPH